MVDYTLILSKRYAHEQWAVDGNEYAGIEWLSESPKPTKAALDKLWTDVEYEAQHEAVQRQRAIAYQIESDPIYMEAQREEGKTLDEWKAKVDEIKARYPYPGKP